MTADGIRQPIIVLGAPRSGTSLLTSLLGAHPGVSVIGEPRLVWRYGNDDHSDELGPEHATATVIEHIHRSFATLAGPDKNRRVVEKTPANSVRPRFVDAVFPDARYVHITRNGWAAVPSMRDFWERRSTGFDAKQVAKLNRRLREARLSQVPHYAREVLRRLGGGGHVPLYGPRLAGLQQVVDEQGCLAAAALQWRVCVERSAAFGRALLPDRYMELRLESLNVTDVARMLEFCGLRPCPSVLEHFRHQYKVDAARRRRPLSEQERALIAPMIMPVNSWLGYAQGPSGPTERESQGPSGPTERETEAGAERPSS